VGVHDTLSSLPLLDQSAAARDPARSMQARGSHLLVEYRGCDPVRLSDAALLERALRDAAEAIGATVVSAAFHGFAPHGVTGILLLAESHLSVHSWPEHGYAAVDAYTCGVGDLDRAVPLLADALGARQTDVLRVARGELDRECALRVEPHGSFCEIAAVQPSTSSGLITPVVSRASR